MEKLADAATELAGRTPTIIGYLVLVGLCLSFGQAEVLARVIDVTGLLLLLLLQRHANKRDDAAQAKLNETVRATPGARDELAGIEDQGEKAAKAKRQGD